MLSLLLFLSMLVGIDAQGCTIEMAVRTTEYILKELYPEGAPRYGINFTDTNPNCLVTSEIRGLYKQISISIKFYRYDDNSTISEARYNYICFNNVWNRWYQDISETSYFNGTRSDCSDCSNTTVNDYHCQR